MRPLCVLAALLLAGCAAPAAQTPATSATPAAPADPVLALADCGACWEPAAAVDAQGRIFAVLSDAPRLAVSSDGGRTFKELATPPMPADEPGRSIFDGYVATGPDGALHYLAFLGVSFSVSAAPTALQVARSSDGGATWDANLRFSLASDASKNVLSPWKSWIGFGPGRDVYVAYNQRGGLVMLAKSSDGGLTYGPFQRLNEGDVAVSNFPSGPVVDGGGRVGLAYFGDQSPAVGLNPFYFQGHALKVALSDDGGTTFRTVVARAAQAPDFVGTAFPSLAVDAAGRWHIAYWDAAQRMVLVTSPDRGATWSEPRVWSDGGAPEAAPWLAAGPDGLTLLWQDAAPRVRWAHGPATDAPLPTATGVAVEGHAQGDFAQFARLADGRLVVPFGGDGGLRVALASAR